MPLLFVGSKILSALFVCSAVAHALWDNPFNVENDDEDMITCLIENGLDPGIYEGIYNHRKLDTKLPTEDQKNCYLACMFKNIGYMKKDGTFNVETIITESGYGPEKRKESKRKLGSIVNICKLQAGSDICKMARCYQDLKKSPRTY